jgi:hypothetical protein
MAARPYFLLSAGTTNLTQVSTQTANLAGGSVINTNVAARYLKFYSSGANGANPVVGTTVPWLTVQLPASSQTSLSTIVSPFVGVGASGPLWIATTVNVAYTDTTAITAGDLYISLFLEG